MSRFFNKKQAAATQKKIAVAADSDASSNSDADSDADSDENNSMFAAQSSQSQSQKKAATSRFGRALAIDSDSDSDSDSDDDSDDSDDSDAPRKKPLQKQQLQPTLIRDKRFDEMRNIIKPLMNAKKINDWVSIQNEFDRLNNAYQKVASIQPDEKLPHPFRFYYRALATLEDAHKAHTESGKTLNAVNQKAFTGMKSKLKKLCKTKEEEIASWRENPLEEEASEAEAIELARSLAAPAGGAIDAGDESDDSIFGKDDDDSDSDSEPEIDEEADKNLTSWERVLKKFGRTPKKDDDGSDSDEDGGKKKLTKEEKKIARVARKVTIAEEAVAAAPVAPTAGDGFTSVTKGKPSIDVTPENLYKKLHELILARGKKSTDKVVQIEHLSKLLEVATTAHMKVQVLLVLIPSQFDYNPASTGGFLPADYWKSTRANIDLLLSLLETNHNITITETTLLDDVEPAQNEAAFLEGRAVSLRGNLYSFIDRLSDEFIKSLQHIDPHTTEYIERLKDETPLYVLIVRGQKYFDRLKATESSDACILKRVLHIYYKTENVIAFMESALPAQSRESAPAKLVHVLCTALYQTSDIRIRARALLCHVYHLALHGKFYEARDMLLMSHLQEQVQNTDIDTQILYNRTVVQLGMSAFRSGLIRESANALQDFFGSGKTKELLAQGFQVNNRFGNAASGVAEKTPEQERLEKQRLLPFHMHINLELLECIYLTCSMLLEIPNMAMYAHDSRRKMISKPFRRNLDYNQKQVFIGPPENTRDHIMAAAKSLSAGEWEKCRDFINAIKIWTLMPDASKIKEMLAQKIQEEGLRTYIFQFAPHYDSLGLHQLSAMFDLPVSAVHSIIAKMIVSEELCASLDEPTQTVVLHRNAPGVEMSRLEYLAGVYADKVQTLVDSNEKMLESRSIMLGLQQQQQQQQLNAAGGAKRTVGGGSSGGASGARRTGNKVGFN